MARTLFTLPSCAALSALLGALAGLGLAHAAPPSQQSFSMAVGVEHDSNITLSPVEDVPVTRWRASPRFEHRWFVGQHEWALNLGALIERSTDEAASQNRQDPSVALSWQWGDAVTSWRARAGFDEASARATALEETGQVVRDATRSTRSLSGGWSHALNDRDTLGADVSLQDVRFTEQAQVNYRNSALSARYSRRFSEVMEGSINLRTTHYSPDTSAQFPLAASSRSHGLTMGVQRQLTPAISMNGQLGLLYFPATRTKPNSDNTWQGTLGLTHEGQFLTSSVSLARASAVDNQAGGYTVNDSLRIQGLYALAENTSVGAVAGIQRADGPQTSTSTSLGLNLNHQLSEHWGLSLNLQHRRTSRDGQPDARSNLVGAQVSYSNPDL